MQHDGETDVAERRDGFLVGAAVGAGLAASSGTPAGSAAPDARRAPIVLADELIVELLGGGVDLRRLAGRWVAWHERDLSGSDPLLGAALNHLREFDAPPHALPSRSIAAVAAALPAALASASPRAMIAGAFHVSRMLDPDELTALSAVAVVVAASELLAGHRDFIGDVLAALRANDAPESVLEAMRAIPRDPHVVPTAPRGSNPDPVDVAAWVLRVAYHRRRGVEVMHEVAVSDDLSVHVGAIAGALLGARDGIADWPIEWSAACGAEVTQRRAVAVRLASLAGPVDRSRGHPDQMSR